MIIMLLLMLMIMRWISVPSRGNRDSHPFNTTETGSMILLLLCKRFSFSLARAEIRTWVFVFVRHRFLLIANGLFKISFELINFLDDNLNNLLLVDEAKTSMNHPFYVHLKTGKPEQAGKVCFLERNGGRGKGGEEGGKCGVKRIGMHFKCKMMP